MRFCDRARKIRPDIVFGADLIAGFPTETPEMFDHTLDLVEDSGLTYLHVFPFSPRPRTPAARMPQVPRAEVKARAARLRQKGAEALCRHLAASVGQTAEVLIESAKVGRTEHFAPVRLDSQAEPGTVIKAVITGHDGSRLEGRPA